MKSDSVRQSLLADWPILSQYFLARDGDGVLQILYSTRGRSTLLTHDSESLWRAKVKFLLSINCDVYELDRIGPYAVKPASCLSGR